MIRRSYLALVVAALAVVACGRQQAQEPPPPKVTVAHPVERELTDWDEYTARLEAVDSVEVRARVSGYLESVHFRDGSMVKKGDLLFEIDPAAVRGAAAPRGGRSRAGEVARRPGARRTWRAPTSS